MTYLIIYSILVVLTVIGLLIAHKADKECKSEDYKNGFKFLGGILLCVLCLCVGIITGIIQAIAYFL